MECYMEPALCQAGSRNDWNLKATGESQDQKRERFQGRCRISLWLGPHSCNARPRSEHATNQERRKVRSLLDDSCKASAIQFRSPARSRARHSVGKAATRG